jgi:hypothetical protein
MSFMRNTYMDKTLSENAKEIIRITRELEDVKV